MPGDAARGHRRGGQDVFQGIRRRSAAGVIGLSLAFGPALAPAQTPADQDPASLDAVLDDLLGAPTPAPAPTPPVPTPPAATPVPPAASPATAAPLAPRPAPSGPRPKSAIPWLREALGGGSPSGAESAPAAGAPRLAPLEPVRPGGAPGAITDPSGRPYPGQNAAATPPSISAAATPPAIEIAPMGEIDRSGVGLATAEEAGLPTAAWRGVFPDQARYALDQLKPGPFRAANQIALRMLTAALAPPQGGGAALFRARLEAIARFGAAREAALIAREAGDPLILEGADAAFVSGEETALCAALLAEPGGGGLERVYCQIITEDRAGARLALDAAQTIGGDPATLTLLEILLEEIPPEQRDPAAMAAEPTPLRIAALRRLSAPPQANLSRSAPLSLAAATLSMDASPRQRLEALERLEAAGSATTDDLRLAFSESASAESGGVWGRVEAYRDAVEADDPSFIYAAEAALARAEEAGRRAAMARLLAPAAAARSLPAPLTPEEEGAPEMAVEATPPPPEMAIPAMRALLREGGEGGAAAALGRTAMTLGEPAVPPDLLERALDHLIAPAPREDPDEPWTELWSEDDAEDLTALARGGDRRAAFVAAAIVKLDAPAPTPLDRPRGQLRPGGIATPAEEVADGRAALLIARAFAALAAAEPTDREVLFAIETARALGWEAEARALALEAAMARR